VFVVEGTSIDTTIKLVGSVSIVAPAVLTSDHEPVPFTLNALTLTLMRLSLGKLVNVRIADIGAVHCRLETTSLFFPSQLGRR